MIGLVLIGFILTGLIVAHIYYNKGLTASGHVCSTKGIDTGIRYEPKVVKQVNLHCPKCLEQIPSEIKVLELTHKTFPFQIDVSDTDFNWHMETYHGKVGTEEK